MSKLISSTSQSYKVVDDKIEILKVKEIVAQDKTSFYLFVQLDESYILDLIKADLRNKGVDFDSATTTVDWLYYLNSSNLDTDFMFRGVKLRKAHVWNSQKLKSETYTNITKH